MGKGAASEFIRAAEFVHGNDSHSGPETPAEAYPRAFDTAIVISRGVPGSTAEFESAYARVLSLPDYLNPADQIRLAVKIDQEGPGSTDRFIESFDAASGESEERIAVALKRIPPGYPHPEDGVWGFASAFKAELSKADGSARTAVDVPNSSDWPNSNGGLVAGRTDNPGILEHGRVKIYRARVGF